MNGKFRQVEKSFDFWAVVFSPWLSPSKSGSALDFTKTLLLIPSLYSRRVGNVGFGDGRHGFRLRRPVETATPAKTFGDEVRVRYGCSGTLRTAFSASSDKTVTVTGIVRDEAGKPMSGVGVIVKGMLTGTVTGTDGSYALKARPNDELSFSFLGYKTQEVFVGSKSTIDITLVDEAQAIDGVVVTALGLKRDEKSLGYAASKVDGDVLASSATSTNWLSGLTGQVPD